MKFVIILENQVKEHKKIGIPFVWNADFGFRNG